jgi:hypothetical protein
MDRAVLLGARLGGGKTLIVGAAGISHTTGALSDGEDSGSSTPIKPEYAPAGHVEVSFAFTHVFGMGVAVFRTGGSRSSNSGGALIVQLGFLR